MATTPDCDGTVVCVDAGTSLIKAVRYDAAGRELAVERRPTVVSTFPDGRSEQDMDEVWTAVADAVRAVTAPEPHGVRAIALTAQGDGAWLVDRVGRPVRPAVLWNDARAASVVERWRADGVLDEAFRRTGSARQLRPPARDPAGAAADRTRRRRGCTGGAHLRRMAVPPADGRAGRRSLGRVGALDRPADRHLRP